MEDSELMEKAEVMGRTESIIKNALNGRAIYIAEFGTTVVCALVATIYRCMYMVKARYNDGKYNVEVTAIDPSYKDFGVTYYGTVDKDSMPSEEEWKAREKPKMNICIMCICTDKSYFLDYEYDNGVHATVAFNNHIFASVKEGSDLISNYAGPVTFNSYVDVVLSGANAKKKEEPTARMLTNQDIDKLNKIVENSNHISWNVYFMAIAKLASKRSKDPRTKVGAVIVTPDDNRIVSVGYNGFPYGCSDEEFPWVKGDDLDLADTKYAYVVHAELNAILSARGRDLTGCHIYVTSSPCNECTKAIIQAGIKKIVYMEEYNPGSSGWVASSKMCKAAGVEMELYKPEGVDIDLGRF